jgi:hypothetical protein
MMPLGKAHPLVPEGKETKANDVPIEGGDCAGLDNIRGEFTYTSRANCSFLVL